MTSKNSAGKILSCVEILEKELKFEKQVSTSSPIFGYLSSVFLKKCIFFKPDLLLNRDKSPEFRSL